MLSKSGQIFTNGYRSGIASRLRQCISGREGLRLDAGTQRTPCTGAAGGDLRLRADVDWWAGGASDGYETWRELARHSRTPSSRPPSGRPSEKVAGKGGRSSRMLLNPFQGIREPHACVRVMLENRFEASTMTRAVGLHTLQKAVHSSRNKAKANPDDIATVSRWLSPLLEPEPRMGGTAKPKSSSEKSQALASAQISEASVCQLRERGAVLLLYSLAKLNQAKGWRPLLEDECVKSILQLLLQRMEQLACSLDPQAVSNSLYALALLQCRTGPLIAGLTVAVDSTALHMDAQQCSNVLWALAKLDVALPDTLLTVTRELATRQSNAQDIANSIWALGHLDCTPNKHMQEPVGKLVVRMLRPLPAVGDERISRGHLSSFSPRHHINVLWGLSKLGLHSTALYDTSAALLIPHMVGVGDKGLAMLASVFGGGFAHTRQKSQLALPLLCSVADSAHARVLQGRIIPDALAQCIWHLWVAAAAPSGAVGFTQQQLSRAEQNNCAKRLLAASACGEPIHASEELDSIPAGGHAVSAGDLLAMQPAEGAVATQQRASAVSATPRSLHDCVHTLVSALGTIRPQVADRLLQSMQPRQLLQVLVAATTTIPGKKKIGVLERLASPLLSALWEMKPSEVGVLCQVMSRAASEGAPMDAELATAVALHMWSGKSGVSDKQREVLLGKLRAGYSLPIQVQTESTWGKRHM